MPQPVEEMRCEAVVDHIEAFVDDELDADETRAIQYHLDSCAECRRETEHARTTVAVLRGLPELEVPERVIERTRTVIDRKVVPQIPIPITTPRKRWMAAAAALVMSAAAIFALVNRGPEPGDAEALRAAAEVRIALATIDRISRRANQMAKTQIIDDGILPITKRGLARSLQLQSTLQSTNDPATGSPEINSEGSS